MLHPGLPPPLAAQRAAAHSPAEHARRWSRAPLCRSACRPPAGQATGWHAQRLLQLHARGCRWLRLGLAAAPPAAALEMALRCSPQIAQRELRGKGQLRF